MPSNDLVPESMKMNSTPIVLGDHQDKIPLCMIVGTNIKEPILIMSRMQIDLIHDTSWEVRCCRWLLFCKAVVVGLSCGIEHKALMPVVTLRKSGQNVGDGRAY